MSSEIRANTLKNRVGLSTINITNTGIVVSGIVTCTELSGLTALNIAGVGTANILNLYDGSNLRFYVNQYGNPTVTSGNPVYASTNSSSSVTTTLFSNSAGQGVLQTNSGHDLILATGSVEKLRITSTGNVSIGNNATPDTLLHLKGDKPKLRIESTNVLEASAGTEEIARIEFEATKGSNQNVAASMRVRQDGTWSTVDDWFSPTAIEFYTQDQSGTEITTPRLTIKSTGNVGIGTDNPSKQLSIYGDSDTCIRVTSSAGGAASLQLGDTSDTVKGAITFLNSDNSLRIRGHNNSDRIVITSDGSVRIGEDGTFTADTGADDLVVGNANSGVNRGMTIYNHSGSDGRLCFAQPDDVDAGMIKYSHGSNVLQFFVESSERVRIKDSGEINVYRGDNGDVFEYWRVSQSLFVVDNLSNESNTRMRIRNPNGTINYNSSSDYRLKENDVKITDGITRLKKLRPIQFKWKSGTNTYDGFFAHEVSEACPMAVDGTKDQVATADDVSKGYANNIGDPIYQGIDHSKMVPLLTAALQEAVARIEALESSK